MKHACRLFMKTLLLLALLSCEQQDPWHDSDGWNAEATASHLAVLVQAQVEVLEQAIDLSELPQDLRQELWALMIDECDTGYEVFVRVNRNGGLKEEVCQALSTIVDEAQSRKEAFLKQLESDGHAAILESTAPSDEAWAVILPRINGYSVQALRIRCLHPEGYWDWSLPSD